MKFNRPFTKLPSSDQIETGFIISFAKFPEIEEEFYKNILRTISKISSSKKTKALSLLCEKKVLTLGYGLVNLHESTIPVYGMNHWDDNTLRNIVLDVSKLVPANYNHEFISNLNIISSQIDIIKTNESMLTTTGTDQINMAKESIQSKYKELLMNIDWFLLIDLYYYQYLRFLTKRTVLQNKGKVFGHLNEILHQTIKKIILGYSTKKELEFVELKTIQILIDYLMIIQYTNNPPQETFNTVLKATISGVGSNPTRLEELDNLISKLKELKPTKYHKLQDITYILAEAKIMNITPNAFSKLLTDNFGKKFFDFNHTLDTLVAYLISSTYSSELFQNRNIPLKEEVNRLEELVLNSKGSTLIKSF
jgi:hypothetical protein